MGDVVPIGALSVARIEADIRAAFADCGSIVVPLAEVIVDVAEWRAAARRVARSLGRRVQTGVHPDGTLVWAALADWPINDKERRRTQEAMRRAVRGTT